MGYMFRLTSSHLQGVDPDMQTFTALWYPQRLQNNKYALYRLQNKKYALYKAYLLFRKRWGSYDAVNVCMPGPTP